MTGHRSYYEVILVILSLFLAVAFLKDVPIVQIFVALFIVVTCITKEIVMLMEDKREIAYQKKIQSIYNNEMRQDIEKLRDEINNINLTLFNR